MSGNGTDGCLQVEQRGAVRWLRLNRPARRNALNGELIEALTEQITLAETDPQTAVVAVAGNGPSFCAGGDLRHFLQLHQRGHNPVHFLKTVSDCFSRIEASPVPWVAVLHGHVVAGGLELALACDVVIAAAGTMIGDGHLNNQLLPAAGSSVRLARAVGHGRCRWLLLTGELLPASELADTGWILRVVPPDRLDEAAETVCARLAERAGPAQRNLKALLHRLDSADMVRALRQELDAFAENWDTGHPPAAVRAFLRSRVGQREVR
ncbi:enoyl-CoA hydratase/isomerase family protein [Mycobacterium persicum]|uniref:Enoyl-CoA hydratase n=1 Tax=Mycobacterium persicum TaxID=1487726 RepID=A0A1X0L918_9MYCO|nr:enoyl-CoA hydratase/isomerase family protein [Mycobacterium persicum]KZS82948.1 enoyl-CoA hydratase [Mycobacterium persicum]ORB48410.1 enoyl-CoA hydratase [Mycobacterium persicum]ORB89412.1 enoyl-CoA hydratase [Mycobacterium persicum]ORB94863.1 enoyl-CoA hydratase [Mycobacterium persicum]ORC01617.1 enoyl-CoA hydratase [Mycobacterium persicum]